MIWRSSVHDLFPLSLCFSPAADLLLSDEVSETTSDQVLAKMLQLQFDREFDDQLRREEKRFNGDSKGSYLNGMIIIIVCKCDIKCI